MTIDLVFINYNRLAYTELALPALLADPTEDFSLTIWDNGSTDGTREYLSSVDDPRIVERIFPDENMGLNGAVNHMIEHSSADLLGIIFDDDLVNPGWTRPLAQAHGDVAEFGMIGCWHFLPEAFDYERAKHKVQKFGEHEVFRHPWTGVGAGLIKVKTLRECGPLESSRTTNYWRRVAQRGYVNGYYLPLIFVEHMDYPWSEYFRYADKFDKWLEISTGAKRHNIRSIEDARAWHQIVVNHILDSHWDVKYHVGWRRKVQNLKNRIKKVIEI